MKRCMYCGQENEDSASSCVKCGNPLLDMPAEDEDTLEEMPEEMFDDFQEAEGAQVQEEAVEEAPAAEPAQEEMAANEAPEQEEIEIPETETPVYEEAQDEITFPEEDNSAVGRGQTYAARAQYEAQAPEEEYEQPQDYGYNTPDQGNAQYGGQAYGYPEDEQEYDQADDGAYDDDYEDAPAGNADIQRKSRKMVKSVLFFLAALVFTVSAIAELVNIVSGAAVTNLSTVTATIRNLTGDNMVISLMTNTVIPTVTKYQQENALLIPAIGVALALPQILIALGMWMAFGATSAKKQEVKTSGLTMIRVIEIIKFVFICLALLAVIGLTVSFVVAAAAAGSSGSMMTLIIGIITLLVVVIAAVFVIMYYVQLIFAVRAIRTNVRNGESVGRIPGFVIFIGFLCCCATVAAMLPMAPDDYPGLAARGSKALFLLLITLWALVYRLIVKVKQN